MLDWLRSAEESEVRRHEETLRACAQREDVEGLRELALEVGASIYKLHPGHGEAPPPELVHNIHVALQTRAMLATLRTTSNYVIATWVIALATIAVVAVTL